MGDGGRVRARSRVGVRFGLTLALFLILTLTLGLRLIVRVRLRARVWSAPGLGSHDGVAGEGVLKAGTQAGFLRVRFGVRGCVEGGMG